MKIFLDDIREPSECAKYMHNRIGKDNLTYLEGEWYIVRNYDQFCRALVKYEQDITHISFDHDLADEHYTPEEFWETKEKAEEWASKQEYKEKTGYDCAVFFNERFKNKQVWPTLYVHSMNPVGTERIINLFKMKII